jgi:exosortase
MMSVMQSPIAAVRSHRLRVPAALLGLGAVLLWAIWPTLSEMSERWSHDPTYSHGYLVPLFALGLLWLRRDRVPEAAGRPNWWGVVLVAVGAVMQLTGVYLYVRWLSGAALIAYLGGLCVLLGGWRWLRWAWPAIAFLVFMIPLPYRIEVAMKQPLQRLSTVCSAYALQTLGVPALAEGNIIVLADQDIYLGVIDACSGLKMLIVFFCMATAVALIIERPLDHKLLIVLSAVPIAIISNVVRITVTGVLHETVGSKWADLVFHDLAGWLMMPLALGLLWVELRILSHLLIEAGPARMVPIVVPGTGSDANRARRQGGSSQHPERPGARGSAGRTLIRHSGPPDGAADRTPDG